MLDIQPARGCRGAHLVARVAVIVAVALSPVWCAGAAGSVGLTTFSLTPLSGPGGTVITVSGSGCSPGPLQSAAQVQIAVATVPPTNAQITTHGTWSDTLTIPATAMTGNALVTAVCVSLSASLPIYGTRTFTVTAPSTTTSPPTTAPSTTPTTVDSTNQNNPAPTTQAPTTSVVHSPGTTSETPNTPTTLAPGSADPRGPTGAGTDPNNTSTTTKTGTHHAATRSRTDSVGAPDLSLGHGQPGDSGGLGWILWLLLIVAVASALGLLAWWYRARRHPDDPELNVVE